MLASQHYTFYVSGHGSFICWSELDIKILHSNILFFGKGKPKISDILGHFEQGSGRKYMMYEGLKAFAENLVSLKSPF